VSSQSGTVEKYLATGLQWTTGNGWRIAVSSEETIASSQSVIGEKYLETKLQWTVGNGRQVPKSQAKRSVCPVKL
jgi:hypothetical protein